jgi:hypothetical protein
LTLQDAKSLEQSVTAGNAVEIAFEVEDVEALREKLGDRAVVQTMGWGKAIETVDPDGNRLNIYRF